MIWIKNKVFPFGSYNAINICGIVFYKDTLSAKTKNHERIHTRQMLETLFIGFYLWYGIEYLIVCFSIKNKMIVIMMFHLKKKLTIMILILTILNKENVMLGLSI